MMDSKLDNLPSEWTVKEIGDLYDSQYGYTESATEENTGVKFLRITDISDSGFVQWPTVPFCKINEEDYKKYELKEGDLLVARIGATTGKTCVISSNERTSVFASYLIRLERKNNEIDPRFGFFFTQSGLYWDQINANKHGKLKKGVSATLLRSLDIPFPPLPEQRKIASILTTVQDAIEQTEAVIQATRELKKSMMKHLFTYGPVPVNQTDQVELEETEIGPFPADWEVVELKKLYREGVYNGAFVKKDKFGKGVCFLNVKDTYRSLEVIPNQLERVNVDQNEIDKYRLEKGDLIYVRSSLKREGIGQCCFFEDSDELVIYDCHLMRVRVDHEKANPKFLAYYSNSPVGKRELISKSKTTTMTTINQASLGSLKVPLPPKDIQNKIVKKIDLLSSKEKKELDKKTSLEALFNSLLDSLMTAKIRVV